MREVIEFLLTMMAACLIVALFVVIISVPFVWLEGRAKSALLKQQGIELPWYQAAFLNVNVNNQAGKISIEGVK